MNAMEIKLANLLAPLMTIGLRVSGLMIFAPVFGSAALPMRIKAVLVIALTAVLYSALSGRAGFIWVPQWPLVVVDELLIGMALGLAANLLFEAVQLAGQVLSVQMGFSLVNILDPQTQAESTVLAMFHQTVAVLVFLGLNVHLALVRVLAESFEYLPVESARVSPAFATATLKLGGALFSLGVQFAAPVVAATLVADVIIGLMGKSSPQMPLMLLGPAIKSMLGAGVLLGVMKYWPDLLEHCFRDSFVYAQRLLHLAR
jgi:flagellar biosynthesis protein FliR